MEYLKGATESILLGLWGNQENLTEVLWQCFQPCILNYLSIYVYTGFINMYYINPYLKSMRARVSHKW